MASVFRSRNEQNLYGQLESGPPTWLVRNKIDLIDASEQRNESETKGNIKNEYLFDTTKPLKNIVKNALVERNEVKFTKNDLEFNLSAATGEGFDRLLGELARKAEKFLGGTEFALVTRERHRRALEDALAALRRAQASDVASREDLMAEELRIAARALGRLIGRVDVEDILDVIFQDFCIGK